MSGREWRFEDVTRGKMYECPICLDIMKNCTQMACNDHTMCFGCIWNMALVSSEHGSETFRCPVCRTPSTTDDIRQNRKLDRLMLAEIVFCVTLIGDMEEECGWKGRLEDLQKHKDTECGLKLVACPDCKSVMSRKYLLEHTKLCQDAFILCPQCKKVEVMRKELRAHYDNDCPETEVLHSVCFWLYLYTILDTGSLW